MIFGPSHILYIVVLWKRSKKLFGENLHYWQRQEAWLTRQSNSNLAVPAPCRRGRNSRRKAEGQAAGGGFIILNRRSVRSRGVKPRHCPRNPLTRAQPPVITLSNPLTHATLVLSAPFQLEHGASFSERLNRRVVDITSAAQRKENRTARTYICT